jgi:hypothetical protein
MESESLKLTMNSDCLNCGHPLAESYCSKCGQKASTHRYSLRNFIEHDFINGVWGVDKGVLYTLKELFTRPGHSVREYVLGKRVYYFNFVALILLILTISALLAPYTHIKMSDLMPEASKAAMNSFENFTTQYPKLLLLIAIPLNSFFSFIWFRRARFNYAEHLVLNSYKTAAELILGLVFSIFTIFYTNINVLAAVYFILSGAGGIIYGVWFYSQFFSKSDYSKTAVIVRSVLIPLSFIFLSLIIGFAWGVFEGVRH